MTFWGGKTSKWLVLASSQTDTCRKLDVDTALNRLGEGAQRQAPDVNMTRAQWGVLAHNSVSYSRSFALPEAYLGAWVARGNTVSRGLVFCFIAPHAMCLGHVVGGVKGQT